MVALPHLVDVDEFVSPVVVADGAVKETLRCRADAGQNDGVDAAKWCRWMDRMMELKS